MEEELDEFQEDRLEGGRRVVRVENEQRLPSEAAHRGGRGAHIDGLKGLQRALLAHIVYYGGEKLRNLAKMHVEEGRATNEDVRDE